MKKNIPSVFMVMLMFSGCVETPKTPEKGNETSIDLNQAECSKITETDVFLNFKFGMTENEVIRHIKDLQNNGKVYTDADGSFQYDFITKTGLKLSLSFVPFYYEGKLYKMTFPISSLYPMDNEYIFLMVAFRESEKMKDSKFYVTKDTDGEEIYTSVKNNLVIRFESNSMIYENAPIAKLAEEKERKVLLEKAKESSSNF